MANDYGFSFQPGPSSVPLGGNPAARPGGPQSAVEIRSLSIPQRSVPGQIAPQQLLQSLGGGGGLDVNILRRLLSLFAPMGQQPVAPTPLTAAGAGGGSMTAPSQPYQQPYQPYQQPYQPYGEVPLTSTPAPAPKIIPGTNPGGDTGNLSEPVAPTSVVSPPTQEGFDMSGAFFSNPALAEKYNPY